MTSSSDPLAKLADFFGEVAGRELSAEAMQAASFLSFYGCEDIVQELLFRKRYQTSASEVESMVEKTSAAQASKDLINTQAAANATRV